LFGGSRAIITLSFELFYVWTVLKSITFFDKISQNLKFLFCLIFESNSVKILVFSVTAFIFIETNKKLCTSF
jgi:hypothetical protein